jgi:hypothetical protein
MNTNNAKPAFPELQAKTTPKRTDTTENSSTPKTALANGSKISRKASLKPKVRTGGLKRPAPLDLSKAKSSVTEETSSKSPASTYATPMSIPTSPPPPTRTPPPAPSASLAHVDQVLSHLRDAPTSASTASPKSHSSSQYSPFNKGSEETHISSEISIRKSPQYHVFLLPAETSTSTSRRTSQGTIFDQVVENESLAASPEPSHNSSAEEQSPRKSMSTSIENLSVPESNPPSPSIYSTKTSGSRRSSYRKSKSPARKMFDFSSTNKITKRRATSTSSISTFSALEISLGTLGAASIRTAAVIPCSTF